MGNIAKAGKILGLHLIRFCFRLGGCRSGNRSKNAARILAEKGYEVVELGTGFRGWSAAGKKTVKP